MSAALRWLFLAFLGGAGVLAWVMIARGNQASVTREIVCPLPLPGAVVTCALRGR